MHNRIILAAALCAAGCGGASQTEKTGTLEVALTQAPSDVGCLQLTVTGATRSVTRSFDLLSGQSTASFSLSGLPTGSVLLSGNAYGAPCSNVTAPNWIAVAQKVSVPGSASVVLQRNGQATVSVNFADDQRAVTTLAGSAGQSGGADGIGSAARFYNPAGAVADGQGNLYVTDWTTVRKVVIATGQVTTIAGAPNSPGTTDGAGAAARFGGHSYGPSGIVCDTGCSNLYVVDTGNCTIRKIALAGPTVSTIAGSSACPAAADGSPGSLGYPQGLAFDPAGNLYVNDSGTVRKVVLPTGGATLGTVSTLAGKLGASGASDGTGSAARFSSYLYGIAFDSTGGNLYVADNGNGSVRKVVVSTAAVTTLAGGGGQGGASQDGIGSSAHFNYLQGLVSDGQGNLFVSDSTEIRKLVLSNLAVVTVAGSTASGSADGTGTAASFTGPFLLGIDGAGAIYAPEPQALTIRTIAMP